MVVELGEHDISGKTEHMATNQIKVKRVVVHRDYKAPTFENDIAILELEESIRRQPHIVPICMPEDTEEVFEGRMGIVSGWGRLEYGEYVRALLDHHGSDGFSSGFRMREIQTLQITVAPFRIMAMISVQ